MDAQFSFTATHSFERAMQIQGKAANIIYPLICRMIKKFSRQQPGLNPNFGTIATKPWAKRKSTSSVIHLTTHCQLLVWKEAKFFQEWRSLKITSRILLKSRQLWEKILSCRRNEFQNLCLLVELAFCISASNSIVKPVFNILSLIISDRHLSMSHNMMECCIMISGNGSNWSKREKEQLIERAVDLYMGKRRTSVFAKAGSNLAGTSLEEVPDYEIPEIFCLVWFFV